MEAITYKRSETTDVFYNINLLVYIFGLPNFWIEELKLPKKFINFYNRFTEINNTLISGLICFEFGAFFTQTSLTEKHKSNMLVFGISHPMLYSFRIIMVTHEKKVRTVFYNLTVALKRIHNDPEVEKQMIRSTQMYLSALMSSCMLSMVMYTVDAFCEVARYGNILFLF